MKRLKLFACIALLIAPLVLSQQGYIPKATDFDGSSDYQTRSAALDGSSDSKLGILSFWYRLDGGDGDRLFAGAGSSANIQLERVGTSNQFRITGKNASSVTKLSITTTSTLLASPTWHHFLATWDLGNDSKFIYLDGVADTVIISTFLDDAVSWELGTWTISLAALPWNGALSEFYLTNEYLDISIEANLRKFITADGKPVDLGPSGYKPTGTAPLIYMCAQFNGFGTNCGTGGDFTPVGSVTDTPGPVPILQLAGRAGPARGRGGQGGRR